MLPVFDTPSGLPYSQVNLAKRVGVADPDNRGLVSTAEASTLQLEFRYLGYLTDNSDYWDKAEHVRSFRFLSWDSRMYVVTVCR
jgi:mannosyl-oligosaccharide alpha-1,2-mannosidase